MEEGAPPLFSSRSPKLEAAEIVRETMYRQRA